MSSAFELEFRYQNKRFKDARSGLHALAQKLGSGDVKRLAGRAVQAEMDKFLGRVAKALTARHGKAWPGGTSPSSLATRSGNTNRAILQSVRTEMLGDSVIQGHIGGPGFLKVHEFGTVGAGGTLPDIVPKKAKFLTVPLKDALDQRGVPKKAKAKDWPDTFVFKSKDGRLFIAQKGKNGQIGLLLYRLMDRVAIRPRLNMGATLKAGTAYFVDKASEASLKALLDATRAI